MDHKGGMGISKSACGEVILRQSQCFSPLLRYPGMKPPMVGGIDLVGSVVEAGAGSAHKAGDLVLCNGWGVGTDHYGGYAGEARLQSAWALPLPSGPE